MKIVNISKSPEQLKPLNKKTTSFIRSFEDGGVKYYYKQNASDEYLEYSETFSSFLLEKIGAENFVKYSFAKLKNSPIGVLSQSFDDDSVKYKKTFFDMLMIYQYQSLDESVSLDTEFSPERELDLGNEVCEKFCGVHLNSVEFVNEVMKVVCEHNNIEYNEKMIKDRLIALATYDFFMVNEDRNMSNIEFLIKDKDGKLICELAPFFDFGFTFGVNRFFEMKRGKHYPNRPEFNSQFGITKEGQLKPEYRKDSLYKDGGIIARDIYNLTKTNTTVYDIVKKFMGVDIEATLKEYERNFLFKLDPELRECMVKTFNKQIERYKAFESNKTNNKKISENEL